MSISATPGGTDLCIFERKTLADLAASITDGRYAEQSHRLIHASGIHTHNIVYIIEGSLPGKGAARTRALSAMVSLNLFKGFSVTRTTTMQETAELVISAATKIAKNAVKGEVLRFSLSPVTGDGEEREGDGGGGTAGGAPGGAPSYTTVVKRAKKDNITPTNFPEIVLAQIPGVSANVAALVIARDPTLSGLAAKLREDATYLNDLTIETRGATGIVKTRKLGSNVISAIQRFVCAL